MDRWTSLRLGASDVMVVPKSALLPTDPASVACFLEDALGHPEGREAFARWLGVEDEQLEDPQVRAQAIDLLRQGHWRAVEVGRSTERGGSVVATVDPATDAVPLSWLLPRPVAPAPAPVAAPDEPVLLRVELGALGFDTLGVLTLPRPSAGRFHPWTALTILAAHLQDHPGSGFVALGHQEIGEPSGHSVLRAAALVHLIRDEREPWVAIAAKWGRVRDTQEFLAYLHDERGWTLPAPPFTDEADDATAAAVLAFQRAYNATLDGEPLLEDGVIGAQTLAAIFDTARADLLQWLEFHGTAAGSLVFHDDARVALACAERFKPYPTMPALPPRHAGRLVDLVIVPPDPAVAIDLAKTPEGAGIYDVASIGTLPLREIVGPRAGMNVEIVLRDATGAAVGGATFEVVVPGGAIHRGTLDALGEARIEGLIEGSCRVNFPDLAAGIWALQGTTPIAGP